jgi:hypothetical protein
MILDAGCGNRCMWQIKDSENIIYIDVEKQLQRKPVLFGSNTSLPFAGGVFDTAFFDPPFAWGMPNHPIFSYPNLKMLHLDYPDKDRNSVPSYYGIDRYKTRSELVSYIYRAEKEIYRVLKPDGCLWLRWCPMTSMDENNILGIFQNWKQMLTHEIGSSKRNTGETASYWFMLMKKPLLYAQKTL